MTRGVGALDRFLDNCSDRASTRSEYKYILNTYLRFIYNIERKNGWSSTEEEEEIRKYADKYIKEKRNYEQDMIQFAQFKKGRARTIQGNISIIRTFLKYNGINNFDKKAIDRKIPKNYAKGEREELDLEKIGSILSHSSVPLKAIILIAISSGMRISEILNMEFKDIHEVPNYNFYCVQIHGDLAEKTGHAKTTFISGEAYNMILEWNKVREEYLKRNRYLRPTIERTDKIFPMVRGNASKMLVRALDKAGLLRKSDNVGRYTVSIHHFREFFRRTAIINKVPQDIVEFWIHYSSKAYRNYTRAEQAKEYAKVVDNVSTNSDPELKKKYSFVEDQAGKLAVMKGTLERNNTFLTNELNQRTLHLEELQKQNELLSKLLQEKLPQTKDIFN